MSNRTTSTFRSIGDVIAPIVAQAEAVQRARAPEGEPQALEVTSAGYARANSEAAGMEGGQ